MSQELVIDAPLGIEDAAKRDDVDAVFVDVRRLIPQTRLHANEITAIKVVVGRKGSGKTHILRVIENAAQTSRRVIYSALDDNVLPKRLEQQLDLIANHSQARGYWSKLWRIAISLSIVIRLSAGLAEHTERRSALRFLLDRNLVPEDTKIGQRTLIFQKLTDYFQNYLVKGATFRLANVSQERGPGDLLSLLLEGISSPETFRNFIDHVDLKGLEQDVATLAGNFKPIHVIIDGVDEVSWHQPRMWLDFQVGLFDAVFFFSEAQRNSSWIAVTVAIRTFVYRAVMRSPHHDRVKHMLSLDWTPDSALDFLDRRLLQIAGQHFADSNKLGGPRPMVDWLGFARVKSPRRENEEDVERYFLRHTRLSPRDLIRLFNLLCQRKNSLRTLGRAFDEGEFRAVVEVIAAEVAEVMLKTAAEEIIAFVKEVSDWVNKNRPDDVVGWVEWELKQAIHEMGCEVMEADSYHAFLEVFLGSVLPDGSPGLNERNLNEVEAILFRSNVIAFWNERDLPKRWEFGWSRPEPPRASSISRVGFHSSLILKCDLEVSPHGPVF